MARRTKRPSSWLSSIRMAGSAFIGQAQVVEDVAVPAAETSFRGAGYRVTAHIQPQQALIGSLPTEAVKISGETRRAPEARLRLDSAYFPPDDLRQIPYWDYAQSGQTQSVLVLLSEPPVVRILDGPEDDLPAAIMMVHRWLQLTGVEQPSAVLDDLAQSPRNPVAYVAGFELLRTAAANPADLFARFAAMPGRPAMAMRAIVDDLYMVAAGLSAADILSLARQLLNGWSQEADPAALSGYLVWFDGYGQRTWGQDQELRREVLTQLTRTKGLSFSGPYADQWRQQVDHYADVLMASLNEVKGG